jgi:hypothetical protein
VALTLALAEPHAAIHGLLDEGSAADALATRRHRRTTTRDAAVFLRREPLAMPLLPFMHNVLVQRPPEAVRWNDGLGLE